jgi:DNA-binding CsgD family transcriptional regulator
MEVVCEKGRRAAGAEGGRPGFMFLGSLAICKMKEATIDKEIIEVEAEKLADRSPFTEEQSKVLLCRQRGMTLEEIADVLGKADGTIRSHWQRCREVWCQSVWVEQNFGPEEFGFSSDSDAVEYLTE